MNLDICRHCNTLDICSDKKLCHSCEPLYSDCFFCKTSYLLQDLQDISILNHKNHKICKKCLTETKKCDWCKNEYPASFMKKVYLGGSFCLDCYSQLKTCSNCGAKIHHICLSPTCFKNTHNKYQSYNSPHNYSFKPYPEYKGLPKDNLYFGVELEVERSDNKIPYIAGINTHFLNNNFFYCKRDGSLCNGFEIVTHPFSWGWFLENKKVFSWLFRDKEYKLKSYNTRTCGIHIHMSKKAFTNLHLFKFLRFVYDNQNFIFFISQRKSLSNLERWGGTKIQIEKSLNQALIKRIEMASLNHNRYTAVNLTNADTIELRIFKGTLAEESFFKNIEFARSLFIFSKENGIKDMILDKFLTFIAKNKKLYPNLYGFLERNNIFNPENDIYLQITSKKKIDKFNYIKKEKHPRGRYM